MKIEIELSLGTFNLHGAFIDGQLHVRGNFDGLFTDA
jgi:hypothetical protein